MRIHSDKLTFEQISFAARINGVTLLDFRQHVSQSRANAFSFGLSGSNTQRTQFGGGEHYAATWDEWGMFFADLFEADPQAHCGKRSYQGEQHFHWVTGDRFRTLTSPYQHRRHKWGLGQPDLTGSFSTAQCENCEAIQRWMIGTHTWEDIKQYV